MNLPGTFKFKVKSSDEIYTAKEIKDGFEIYVADNIKLFSLPATDVAQFLGSGMWIMEKELKTNYAEIGLTIGQLVDKKNAQYGDSFNKSGQILEILYPNGVQPNQYRDMQAVTRIIDKLMRIANGNQGDENAYNDVAGYGILMSGGNENEKML